MPGKNDEDRKGFIAIDFFPDRRTFTQFKKKKKKNIITAAQKLKKRKSSVQDDEELY